jgi:hypothetical protein
MIVTVMIIKVIHNDDDSDNDDDHVSYCDG